MEPENEPPTTRPDGESVETAVERGRWAGTPFAVLGTVAAGIWLVAGVVVAAVLLVWWLA